MAAVADAEARTADARRAASVTPAELRVLHYLPTKLPFALIADKLGISRQAAKSRAERAYKKLGVHSRAAAVQRAGTSRSPVTGSAPGDRVEAPDRRSELERTIRTGHNLNHSRVSFARLRTHRSRQSPRPVPLCRRPRMSGVCAAHQVSRSGLTLLVSPGEGTGRARRTGCAWGDSRDAGQRPPGRAPERAGETACTSVRLAPRGLPHGRRFSLGAAGRTPKARSPGRPLRR